MQCDYVIELQPVGNVANYELSIKVTQNIVDHHKYQWGIDIRKTEHFYSIILFL